MAKKTAVIDWLSREEVRLICEECIKKGLPKGGIGETVRREFSEEFSGKTMEFIMDDMDNLTYRFISGEKISWSTDGITLKEEYAQILNLYTEPDIFLVNHLREGTFPLENITLIIDLKTSLITLVHAKLGDSRRPRDVEREFHFGYIKTPESKGTELRHAYTTDLVGKIIDWHYDYENKFVVKHLYMNNEHMAYLLLESHEKEKGLLEAAECDYIKVRDHIYIMSWLEKGHQGMQAVTVIDIRELIDIGSFFGININNKLDNYTFAAWGKFSDMGKQII